MNRKVESSVTNQDEWRLQRNAFLRDPGAYWAEIAKRRIFWYDPETFQWLRFDEKSQLWQGFDSRDYRLVDDQPRSLDFLPWKTAFDAERAPFFKWFVGGKTNACFTEVDGHVLCGFGDEVALIYESEKWDDSANGGKGGPLESLRVSRFELLWQTCVYAQTLRELGLKQGDRIVLYMPNCLEQIYLIQAAKRLGVIYTCVFAGLSSSTLADRLADCGAKVLFTANGMTSSGAAISVARDFALPACSDYLNSYEIRKSVDEHGAACGLSRDMQNVLGVMIEEAGAKDGAVKRKDLLTAIARSIGEMQNGTLGQASEIMKAIVDVIENHAPLSPRVVVLNRDGYDKIEEGHLDLMTARSLAESQIFTRLSMMTGLDITSVDRLMGLRSIGIEKSLSRVVPCVAVEADFPMFIMYTSGTTGKPKGVVHCHGGYLSGVSQTMSLALGCEDGSSDIIYVIGDPGWITGQSYMISGALATRTTSVIAETPPLFPDITRFASIIERYKVTALKAGSTFLKAVMSDARAEEKIGKFDLSTLRIATFCAEPTSPAVQKFGMEHITRNYINSYWATEHGGIVLAHPFGSTDIVLKPDTHAHALPWIVADVWASRDPELDQQSPIEVMKDGDRGELVILHPYPYLARTIWASNGNPLDRNWLGDVARFEKTYFRWHAGIGQWVYTQGDFAARYSDGSFTLHGRSDDVINVSGHRIGTEEIEGVILSDRKRGDSPVANALVAGCADEISGTVPVAFLKLVPGRELRPSDRERIRKLVASEKSEFAVPAAMMVVKEFPETRSGKYVRRMVRSLLEETAIGDTSMLKNPGCLDEIRQAIRAWREGSGQSSGAENASGWLVVKVRGADEHIAKNMLNQCVAQMLEQSIGLSENSLSAMHESRRKTPLRQLGLSSIKGVNFVNVLRNAMGPEYDDRITVTFVFSHTSLYSICNYLFDEIFNEKIERSDLKGVEGDHLSEPILHTQSEDPIAIVGMGCRFPGGVSTPAQFWEILRTKTNAISDLPASRWNATSYESDDPDEPGTLRSSRGGFVDNVERFDAEFFSIPPSEALALDPQHRLLMETSWEAFENAGIKPSSLDGTNTGVFVGITTRDYLERALCSDEIGELEQYLATGTALNTASGRLSFFYGLRGPSLSVDTACSSSLVAVHLACESLKRGETTCAVAAGVNLILSPNYSVFLGKAHALSPTASCKTFDESADGYVRSEGCGVIVLKRLNDALRDGNPVLSVILASHVNQDGRSNTLTAPNGRAQAELLAEALRKAALKPEDVSYIEAHGTGTPLGDPVEFRAIADVYAGRRPEAGPLVIGSVKSNIGHTEAAAGMAGLIKTVMCLKNRVILPNLHMAKVNRHIKLESIPASVPVESLPWNVHGDRRIAGVSSFGFSGTNAHVILAEPSNSTLNKKVDAGAGPFLLALSARSDIALGDLVDGHLASIEKISDERIGEYALQTSQGRELFSVRTAVVFQNRVELVASLKEKAKASVQNGRNEPSMQSIAMLFSGQGSQYVGMGRELYDSEPVFQGVIERCEAVFRPLIGCSVRDVMFGRGEKGEKSNLDQTMITQPALFAIEMALFRLWESYGLRPSFVMGHSVGEIGAACAAGVFSLEDGARLIARRAIFMSGLRGMGRMAVVSGPISEVQRILSDSRGLVSVASFNGANSVTISGVDPEFSAALSACEENAYKVTPLRVSHAFHSAQMDPMLRDFESSLSDIRFHRPKIALMSNLTGQFVANEMSEPNYWSRHVREPVRFFDGVNVLLESGANQFLEVGSGTSLLSMARSIAGDSRSADWNFSIKNKVSEKRSILNTLAKLHVGGVDIDFSLAGQRYSTPWSGEVPNYPFQRKQYWISSQIGKRSKQVSQSHVEAATAQVKMNPRVRIAETLLHGGMPFLEDHQVFGRRVLSFSGFLNLVFSALDCAKCPLPIHLFDVVMRESLSFSGSDERVLVWVTKQEVEGSRDQQLEVRSRSESESSADSGRVHLSCRYSEGESSVGEMNLNAAQGMRRFDVSALYANFKAHGFSFGPSFRGLRSFEGNRLGAMGKAVLESGFSTDGYHFHPGLMDSCLQVMVGTSIMEEQNSAYRSKSFLPFSVEELTFFGTPSRELNCQVSYSEGAQGQSSICGDLAISTSHGSKVMTMKSYMMLAAQAGSPLDPRKAAIPTDAPFYHVKWTMKNDDLSPRGDVAHFLWVIISDRVGAAHSLEMFLKSKGAKIHLVAPSAIPGKMESQASEVISVLSGLLRQNVVTRIQLVFCGAIEVPSPNVMSESAQPERLFRESQLSAYYPALTTLQALVQSSLVDSMEQVTFITQGAKFIDGDAARLMSPFQGSAWGLAQALEREYPELLVKRIDLDPGLEPSQQVQAIVAEILVQPGEGAVALRYDKKLVARLVRGIPERKEPKAVDVRTDGSYILTGGFGGIGAVLAKWLVNQGAGQVILLGRRIPDEFKLRTGRFAPLAGCTNIVGYELDVCDFGRVQEVIHRVDSSHPQIRGVIHAAAVLSDASLVNENWEKYLTVCAPKALGLWNLHRALFGYSLDFFILFSSATSLLGNRGQANYAAANSILDSFSYYRMGLGLPCSSINWGPWQGEGMAKNDQASVNLDRQGLEPLDEQEAIGYLEAILRVLPSQVGVLK